MMIYIQLLVLLGFIIRNRFSLACSFSLFLDLPECLAFLIFNSLSLFAIETSLLIKTKFITNKLHQIQNTEKVIG